MKALTVIALEKRRRLLKDTFPRFLLANLILLAGLLAGCSPAAAPMATTEPTAALTAISSATSTSTEIPDLVLEASQNLPEGSGSLTKDGEQWTFDSPESVIVGKDIPVQLNTLTIDGV